MTLKKKNVQLEFNPKIIPVYCFKKFGFLISYLVSLVAPVCLVFAADESKAPTPVAQNADLSSRKLVREVAGKSRTPPPPPGNPVESHFTKMAKNHLSHLDLSRHQRQQDKPPNSFLKYFKGERQEESRGPIPFALPLYQLCPSEPPFQSPVRKQICHFFPRSHVLSSYTDFSQCFHKHLLPSLHSPYQATFPLFLLQVSPVAFFIIQTCRQGQSFPTSLGL